MPNRLKFARRRAKKEMLTACTILERIDETDPMGQPLTTYVPKAYVHGKLDTWTFFAATNPFQGGGAGIPPIQMTQLWFEFPVHPKQSNLIEGDDGNPIDVLVTDHIEANGLVYEIKGIRGPATLEPTRFIDVTRWQIDQNGN